MYFYAGIPRWTYWPFYIWLGIPYSIFIFVLDLHMILFCYSTFCVWQYRDQVRMCYWDIRIKFLLLMWNSHKFPCRRIQIKIIFEILQCVWMSTIQVFPSYNKSVTIVSSNVLHFLFVREAKVYVISKASVHYSVVKINMYISIRIFNQIMK